jgi:hypothetical protein
MAVPTPPTRPGTPVTRIGLSEEFMFGKAGVFLICSSMGKPLSLELGLFNMPDAKEPECQMQKNRRS